MNQSREDRIEREFQAWGKMPPSREIHGAGDDISKNLKKLEPTNWQLEGNVLKADTEWGELVQTIPTDYILDGVDENNLPKFKKIVL